MNRQEFLANRKIELVQLAKNTRKPPTLPLRYKDINSSENSLDFFRLDVLGTPSSATTQEDVVKVLDMYHLRLSEVREAAEWFTRAVAWMEIMEELRQHGQDVDNEIYQQREQST